MTTVTANTLGANPARLDPDQLSIARDAFVVRIDAAADRAMRQSDMSGLPYRLIEASCFLVANGVEAPACRRERYFSRDLSVSRQYLDGITPNARQQEIDSGYAVLFKGRRAVFPDIGRYRAAMDIVATNLEARWAENSARYFARRDAEKAAA
jgi:hypothetical protein